MARAGRRKVPAGDPDERLQRIYATIDAIPRGRVASYGLVATEAGLPGRARMVGRALRELPAGSKLAWFRVINAQGRISQPGKGAREQRRRLLADGVRFGPGGRIDLEAFGWKPR